MKIALNKKGYLLIMLVMVLSIVTNSTAQMPHLPPFDSNPNNWRNWQQEPLTGTWKTIYTSYFKNEQGQAEQIVHEINHLNQSGPTVSEAASNTSTFDRRATSQTTASVTIRFT